MDVLIVDDAPDIRLLVRLALAPHGVEVREAGSGADALDALSRGPLPDAVVLDIQMPVMDGLETLRQIRATTEIAEVPVVLCSVKSREEDIEVAYRLGCDGYVSKPFDLEDLQGAIHAAIASRRVRAV